MKCVRGDNDYRAIMVDDFELQAEFDEKTTREWSKSATWQGLDILETERGPRLFYKAAILDKPLATNGPVDGHDLGGLGG